MRILFISHRLPFPPDKGEKIRAYHVLQYLARKHDLTIACCIDDARDEQHLDAVREIAESFIHVRLTGWKKKVGMVSSLLKGEPLSVSYFYFEELAEQIRAAAAAKPFDAAFVYSSAMAAYVENLGIPVTIMDFCDLDSAKYAQYAEQSGPPLRWINAREARRLAAHEERVARAASHVLFITEREKAMFDQATRRSNVHVLTNGFDFEGYLGRKLPRRRNGPPADGGEIVFTGSMNYRPNVEGVLWFHNAVLPILKMRRPQVSFRIVGRDPAPKISALHDPDNGVEVTGYVKAVQPYLDKADVFVAPLRIARGLQTKVLEAMGCGVPVVSSTDVALPIGATPGNEILVANSDAAFADQVLRLLDDAEQHERVRQAAFAFLLEHFDWNKNLEILDELLPGEPVARLAAAQ